MPSESVGAVESHDLWGDGESGISFNDEMPPVRVISLRARF